MATVGLSLTTIFIEINLMTNLLINRVIETVNFPQKKSTILLKNILLKLNPNFYEIIFLNQN